MDVLYVVQVQDDRLNELQHTFHKLIVAVPIYLSPFTGGRASGFYYESLRHRTECPAVLTVAPRYTVALPKSKPRNHEKEPFPEDDQK